MNKNIIITLSLIGIVSFGLIILLIFFINRNNNNQSLQPSQNIPTNSIEENNNLEKHKDEFQIELEKKIKNRNKSNPTNQINSNVE